MVGRLALLWLLAFALPGLAQQATPNPPVLNSLALQSYDLTVSADETMATIIVEQVFYNPGSGIREANFFFPLPAGAAVAGLELKMGGRYFGGNLLKSTRARDIYRSITTRRRDPALLECIDKDLYQCRVFPVPARSTASVRFAYKQPLASDGAMRKLVLPLDATRFNRAPAEKFRMTVTLKTKSGLQAIFCPTHAVKVERVSAHEARVSLSAQRAYLAGDMRLHYAVEDAPIGAVVSSYRPLGRSGYFVLSLDAAFAREKARKAPRDVVVAVDTSNSAGRNEIDRAAAAVARALTTLRPTDRFALMAFSTEPRLLADFQRADEQTEATVRDLLSGQPVAGRTRLGVAMQGAWKQARRGRPGTGIVMLTDGVETAIGADPATVAGEVAAAGSRVGLCGLGRRVDTVQLDTLGAAGEGDAAYPARSSELDQSVKHLLETTRSVPLTDIRIEVSGAYEVYPKRQRMLSAGDSVLVAGRYPNGGDITVRLSGRISGERVTRRFKVRMHSKPGAGDPSVARMWASRRVGALLERARKAGNPDLHAKEIGRLGRQFGIVTPHSSLLVLEEADQKRFLNGLKRKTIDESLNTRGGGTMQRNRVVTAEVRRDADLAARIRRLTRCENGAENPFADLLGKNRLRLRRADGRTFYKGEDGTWVEAAFVGQDTSGARKVVFLSEDWFALAKGSARILALGQRVLFEAADGTVVQVVDS
jgi:Ca-activated chloride channel family protein